MKNRLGLRTVLPAAFLAAILILTLAFACTSATASAENSVLATEDSSLTFGQVSDIHYFPAEHCYSADAADYEDSDFYHSTTGDTKLVIESGAVGTAHIEAFIEDARKGEAPVYLLATGDLSKNGEHAALIDVANGLRYLQNQVRALGGKYANFQVLVSQGNHDLYNGSGKLYDPDDGSEYQAEVVTSAQFALIFAGLGYPDMTYEALCDIYPAEYWSSSATNAFAPDTDGYVESANADNLTFTYYDENLAGLANGFNYGDYTELFFGKEPDKEPNIPDKNINALSYYVEIADSDFAFFVLDGTDRELTEDVVPVRISEAEYNLISEDVKALYLGTEDGKIATEAASPEDVLAAFANGEPVYADTGYNHITGGRLKEDLLEWMRGLTAANPDRTYIGAYHFNILPHFEQEDDILKDFVFYNWEYIAKSFLEMGIRYGLSGHMHASDVAYYTDAAGRTFYDIETGSIVSYGSPRRYMSVTRYDLADGKVGEKFTSSLRVLDSFDGMNDDGDYENYNDYITENLYGQLVERIVDHFITMRTIDDLDIAGLVGSTMGLDSLLEYIIDVVAYDLYPGDVYPDGNTYDNLMDYVNESVAAELINLKFGDSGQELTLAQIFSFIMMAHAEGLEPTTEEVFGSTSSASASSAADGGTIDPNDETWRARYTAALRDFAAKCDSGQLGRDLFGILLDALYYDDDSILKTLFDYELDLTQTNFSLTNALVQIINNPSVVTRFLPLIESLLGFGLDDAIVEEIKKAEGTTGVTAERFVLSEAMNTIWPVAKGLVGSLLGIQLSGDTLYEGVDNLLNSYLTDSFYVGLSGIAKNIVIAFATDDEIDLADRNNSAEEMILAPHEGYAEGYSEILTYVSDLPVDDKYNPPTQDNGRLPSHLTANFLPSDENGGKFAVSFYTSEEIGAEVTLTDSDGHSYTVSITEDDLNASEDTAHRTVTESAGDVYASVTLTGGTYAQYIPLIDLGLLTISHTETGVEDEDGNFTEYVWGQRDEAPANSVIYKNRWVAVFENLTFGSEYTYAVRGLYQNGEVSKVFDLGANLGINDFTFTSAPSETTTDFDFIAIADMQGMIQSMYEESAEAIDAIMQNAGGYDFVLNAGDMADNGDNFNQWGWALNENVEFFGNTSTISTAGNHEDEGGKLSSFHYYDAFLPAQNTDTGLYFSFDYATAHIIVLNTNDADNTTGISTAQYDWLKADLEANSDAKWTFVLMHKSLYSGGSHSFDGDVAAMREQLVPLFYEYGVDIVFAGHDHTYTVTECLDGEGNAVSRASNDGGTVTMSADGSGVMYVTLGTIGTKFYEYVSNPEIEGKFDAELSVLSTLAEQTFAKVSVRGDTLTFTGYTVADDGTLSAIYNEPSDDMLLVKILVPIAAVILVAGAVTAVVLVRKKKKAAAQAEE